MKIENMYKRFKRFLEKINNPPDKIRRGQVWMLQIDYKPPVYLCVLWEDGEYARVIPLMRRIDVPYKIVEKFDVMFTDETISVSKLGVVAFIRKVFTCSIEKLKNLTYVGELEKENFKMIHHCDHKDYSLIDNKKYYRADIGFIILNRN